MTQHILCAVDLTHPEAAMTQLKKSAELAGFYGATLSVVTVVPDYGMTIVGSFFEEGTMKAAVAAANDKLHELVRDALPDVDANVQHIVEVGSAYEQILQAIDVAKADLVVIGANRPDLADRIQGPNSARVARRAPCSVFVVRD